MVPKLALDVMSCEVMRVLQLTDSCVVPISYQVPRKVQTRSGSLTCAFLGGSSNGCVCAFDVWFCRILATSFKKTFTQTLQEHLLPCLPRSGGREGTSRSQILQIG